MENSINSVTFITYLLCAGWALTWVPGIEIQDEGPCLVGDLGIPLGLLMAPQWLGKPQM